MASTCDETKTKMKAVFSPAHVDHNPEHFVLAGRFAPSPECPDRAHRLIAAITGSGYEILPPKDHGLDAIGAVHGSDYLDFLQNGFAMWEKLPNHGPSIIPNTHPGRHMARQPETIVGRAGYYMADTACPVGPDTWKSALASANTAVDAAIYLLTEGQTVYALCRPPGHHAFSSMAGGFCYLNNTAISAQKLRSEDRINQVLAWRIALRFLSLLALFITLYIEIRSVSLISVYQTYIASILYCNY